MELINEIKNIKSGKKELRGFGILFGGIFIALAAYFYFSGENYVAWFVAGAAFALSGLFFPKLLLPLHKIWMTLAVVLGFFSTRIILTLLFYFIIFPLKFFVKKDLLDETIEREAKTYWQKRENRNYDKTETERQF